MSCHIFPGSNRIECSCVQFITSALLGKGPRKRSLAGLPPTYAPSLVATDRCISTRSPCPPCHSDLDCTFPPDCPSTQYSRSPLYHCLCDPSMLTFFPLFSSTEVDLKTTHFLATHPCLPHTHTLPCFAEAGLGCDLLGLHGRRSVSLTSLMKSSAM